jgi:hypothetical protein
LLSGFPRLFFRQETGDGARTHDERESHPDPDPGARPRPAPHRLGRGQRRGLAHEPRRPRGHRPRRKGRVRLAAAAPVRGHLRGDRRARPDEAAVEEVFLNTNAQSTLKLGHARAAALIAPARAGLLVAEYSTRLVKKAVVGTGAADKAQIGFMIARLLPTAGKTTADCADALAVAITHANLRVANRRVA